MNVPANSLSHSAILRKPAHLSEPISLEVEGFLTNCYISVDLIEDLLIKNRFSTNNNLNFLAKYSLFPEIQKGFRKEIIEHENHIACILIYDGLY